MPTSHKLSSASRLFFGAAEYGRSGQERSGVRFTPMLVHDFGAPITADADGVSTSQTVTVGTSPLATITGALASGGVATFDVPRNVVAGWTSAAVLTVTGTDQYGATMVESSASGTTFAGKKAFKTVTRVSLSANVTGFTCGSGDVLGLPYRVDINDLQAARASNAIDAGTFLPADTTSPATALTGDVRGTYDPAVALNGTNRCQVTIIVADPDTKVGAFGVDQFAG